MTLCAACQRQEATIYNPYLEAKVCQTCHNAILHKCRQLQYFTLYCWSWEYKDIPITDTNSLVFSRDKIRSLN